ncbi:formate dehydrogenase subunit gamma [Hydrogenophilus thermoluteolus]|uniref:formate dehydrogenase subunit gamma n=1 Tax=Hydrogenophilus thermoluteolus TaxID=297 RepID=UPI0018D530B8|nr:formate dehydrogenase subunit gamma [Hydrogenophilus thermoluteolus]
MARSGEYADEETERICPRSVRGERVMKGFGERWLIGWKEAGILVFCLLLFTVSAQGAEVGETRGGRIDPNAPAAMVVPQGHNNAAFFDGVRRTLYAPGVTSIQTPEANVLIQSEGNTWRQIRNGPITVWGGWLILAVMVAITLFYLVKGTIKLHEPATGRKLLRFTFYERLVHWIVAVSFVLLALTGLGLLFGKHLIEPVFGTSVNAALLWVAKNVHNYTGPVFGFFLVLMILRWAKDNLLTDQDWLWAKKFGGLLSGEEIPSGRFNFGEKFWFWVGVTVLGLTVTVTGLILDFPLFGQTRQDMQLAHILHASAALLMIAMAFGHIYIGTIGSEGSLDGMKTGYVDEAWAKQHHAVWYQEITGRRQ